MLASCAIFLQTKDEVLIPPALGQVLYAFFLNRVRNLEPDLAEELHKPAPIKPFTISPLWGKVTYEDNLCRLYPGEKYVFRVTSISPALSRWIRDIWAPSLPKDITLAGAGMRVCGVTFNNEIHPWAGSSTFEHILNSAVAVKHVKHNLSLQFYSPTTFRSRGVNYPLPDPQKVFQNLLQKWNYYSPVNLGGNFIKYIAENVFPSSYILKTRIMHFNNYKQVGFVGICKYGIKRQSEDIMARHVNMLAEFAFYAGVGYKTTMGMGQSQIKYT